MESYQFQDFSKFPVLSTILICGIPGVGKTFFTNKLKEILEKISNELEVICINFDDIFFLDSLDFQNNTLNILKWRLSREKMLEKYQNILKNLNYSKKTIIFLDDNFYLKSMRKPYLKSIKNYQISDFTNDYSYLEIFLTADLDYCFKQNKMRENFFKVPENIIKKIHENFEYSNNNLEMIIEINNNRNFYESDYFGNYVNILFEKLCQNNYFLKNKIQKNVLKTGQADRSENLDNKTKFLLSLEILIRKNITNLCKANNDAKRLSQEISNKKCEFINIFKFYLNTSNKTFKNIAIMKLFTESKFNEIVFELEILAHKAKGSDYTESATPILDCFNKMVNLINDNIYSGLILIF